jgi:dUTP pyrophosphatase
MNLLQTFQVQKLSLASQLPEFVFPLAMGYDLFSCEDTIIESNKKSFVDTGLSIRIPDGMYGVLAPRLSLKSIGVDTGIAVYDPFSEHRVRILLTNNTPHELPIQTGDKIAILCLLPMETPIMTNIIQEIEEEYSIDV